MSSVEGEIPVADNPSVSVPEFVGLFSGAREIRDIRKENKIWYGDGWKSNQNPKKSGYHPGAKGPPLRRLEVEMVHYKTHSPWLKTNGLDMNT